MIHLINDESRGAIIAVAGCEATEAALGTAVVDL